MLQRERSERQIHHWHALDLKNGRNNVRAIASFDLDALRVKAPFGNFFITCGDIYILSDDRVETDLLNSIGREVHARAVLRLICVAG